MHVQKDPFQSSFLTLKPYTLLNFGAPWCNLCLMVQPVVNRLAAEWRDILDVVPVDVDRQWQLARRYNIRSLPTIILLDREGIPIEHLTGFHSRDELLRRCETFMKTRLHQL